MRRLHLEHELPCPPDQFWRHFLCAAFQVHCFRVVLGFSRYRVLAEAETADELRRQVEARPPLPRHQALPLELVGEPFTFLEDGRFDKHDEVWSWTLTANVLPGRLHNQGTVRVEPVGTRRCRRVVDIEVDAEVPLLGPVLDASAIERQREGWERSAAYMRQVFTGAA